jgi:hypothetical protein
MFESAKAPIRLNALNARSVLALSKEADPRILPQAVWSFAKGL